MKQKTAIGLTVVLMILTSVGYASELAKIDFSRYISVDELQPGMKGYGLTVFQGTEPERFEVELVSVMRKYNAGRDAFVIRCLDKRFDIARGVQGCSGSPVYFDGRLAGAMAFGWSFGIEPLYGVTPIAQMLEVKDAAHGRLEGASIHRRAVLDRADYSALMAGELFSDEQITAWMSKSMFHRSTNSQSADSMSLGPLMLAGGIDGHAVEELQSWLGPLRMEAVAGGGTAISAGEVEKVQLAPGTTVTSPLMMGDINGAVLGTVTEMIGDKVFAFGHAWNGEGPVIWPLGTGYIHTFISRTNTSFKLGDALDIVGTLQADESTAVYGTVGEIPTMIPVTVEVQWPYRNDTRTFVSQVASDEMETPMLAAMVLTGALNQKGGMPRFHNLQYKGKLDFEGFAPIVFEGVDTGNGSRGLAREMFSVIGYMLGNPWRSVRLESMHIEAVIDEGDTQASLRSVRLNHASYAPGETVKAIVEMEPLRDKIQTVELGLTLPEDLPDGVYPLVITTSDGYRSLLGRAQTYKYRAESVEDVHRILTERLQYRNDQLFICMVQPRQGVSLRNEGLKHLPSSRTMLLTDDRREIPTAVISELISSHIQVDYNLTGKSEFEIEVKRPAI
ncbi:MAG: hypothetical protein JW709_02350 [Sedimentisphaerales bacterium]|nr:hypothetical protein [Sedimentisphaerales bacterium]